MRQLSVHYFFIHLKKYLKMKNISTLQLSYCLSILSPIKTINGFMYINKTAATAL